MSIRDQPHRLTRRTLRTASRAAISTAAVLGLTEAAVKSRALRAMQLGYPQDSWADVPH